MHARGSGVVYIDMPETCACFQVANDVGARAYSSSSSNRTTGALRALDLATSSTPYGVLGAR